MGVLPQSTWAPEFRIRGTRGGPVTTVTLPVVASQTIKKGDLLKFSSGKLTQAIADSAIASGENIDSGGVSGGVNLFVALHDLTTTSSVTESDKITVAPLNANEIMLQIAVFADTATASAPASTSTAVTDIHAGGTYQYGRYNNGGVFQYGADTETTNGELTLVEDADAPSTTATYSRGWYRQTKGF